MLYHLKLIPGPWLCPSGNLSNIISGPKNPSSPGPAVSRDTLRSLLQIASYFLSRLGPPSRCRPWGQPRRALGGGGRWDELWCESWDRSTDEGNDTAQARPRHSAAPPLPGRCGPAATGSAGAPGPPLRTGRSGERRGGCSAPPAPPQPHSWAGGSAAREVVPAARLSEWAARTCPEVSRRPVPCRAEAVGRWSPRRSCRGSGERGGGRVLSLPRRRSERRRRPGQQPGDGLASVELRREDAAGGREGGPGGGSSGRRAQPGCRAAGPSGAGREPWPRPRRWLGGGGCWKRGSSGRPLASAAFCSRPGLRPLHRAAKSNWSSLPVFKYARSPRWRGSSALFQLLRFWKIKPAVPAASKVLLRWLNNSVGAGKGVVLGAEFRIGEISPDHGYLRRCGLQRARWGLNSAAESSRPGGRPAAVVSWSDKCRLDGIVPRQVGLVLLASTIMATLISSLKGQK